MSEDKCLIEIMEEIYNVWDHVSKEKARIMLKKLILSNNLNTIEEKRLVWHNLATISIQIEDEKPLEEKDMNQAKHYSKALIEMLDNYPNYKNTQINRERYCRALNNYTECFKEELTKEELEDIYKMHYETYKNYNYDDNHIDEYREKLIAQYNLNMVTENFTEVLDVVEDFLLHNNDTQYEEAIKALIIEVKDVNIMLYKQITLLVQQNNIQAI